MTFSQLLGCSASQLEEMSDQQLLEYLGPCLKDCPPIESKVVEENKLKNLVVKKQKIKLKNKSPQDLLNELNALMKSI